MLRFCNRIFQTAVRQKTPLIIISLSVHPISGYLAVWNAVCFIYSNLDESSCVHTFADGIFTSTRILADTKCAHFNFCQYCHPQRTLLECYLSLWSEATRSYSGGISGDIVNSTWVSIKFGSFTKTFSLTSFSISVSTVICKECFWMISLWSKATWSYSSGISGEIVNSAGLDQVWLATSEICDFSVRGHYNSREHSPWQVSALDSHRYFPHMKHWTNHSKWYC